MKGSWNLIVLMHVGWSDINACSKFHEHASVILICDKTEDIVMSVPQQLNVNVFNYIDVTMLRITYDVVLY